MENIENLKFDKKNFNKHTEYGMSLLEKSLRQNGAGRSVLVDRDNNIIAGNGIVEAAVNASITKTRVVEVTGDELVVVRRTDLELDSKQGREMALADNATAAADLAWDYEMLRKELDEKTIEDYGIKIPEPSATEALSAIEYNSCYYEPKEKPTLKLLDCVNFDKFNAKVKVIDESSVGDEMKNVLKWFAYRFIRIDFEAVANYYAFNASDEEKAVMERLRLVLVDGGVDGFIEDELLRIVNTEMEMQDADD